MNNGHKRLIPKSEGDQGHRRLLAKPEHDPALIEQELVRLRSDCAALIHELEGRYDRVMRVPRQAVESTRRIERVVERQVRQHPLRIVGGALVLGAGVLLVRAVLVQRPRRVYLIDERRVRATIRGAARDVRGAARDVVRVSFFERLARPFVMLFGGLAGEAIGAAEAGEYRARRLAERQTARRIRWLSGLERRITYALRIREMPRWVMALPPTTRIRYLENRDRWL